MIVQGAVQADRGDASSQLGAPGLGFNLPAESMGCKGWVCKKKRVGGGGLQVEGALGEGALRGEGEQGDECPHLEQRPRP